eukprot:3983392-Heterocapsa_arctica.AAC.1
MKLKNRRKQGKLGKTTNTLKGTLARKRMDNFQESVVKKRVKLRAEEMHQAKWDRRHQEKEAADHKRNIKNELKKQATVEQKDEKNEDEELNGQAKRMRLTNIGSVREEAYKINNRSIGKQITNESNKDIKEMENLETENTQ